MKEQKTKLSWFQKVILGYIVLVGFLYRFIPALSEGDLYGGIAEGLGSGFAFLLVTNILMWLYNKFIKPKINVQSNFLKKSWKVIRIIIVCLIILWLVIFFFGAFFIK